MFSTFQPVLFAPARPRPELYYSLRLAELGGMVALMGWSLQHLGAAFFLGRWRWYQAWDSCSDQFRSIGWLNCQIPSEMGVTCWKWCWKYCCQVPVNYKCPDVLIVHGWNRCLNPDRTWQYTLYFALWIQNNLDVSMSRLRIRVIQVHQWTAKSNSEEQWKQCETN